MVIEFLEIVPTNCVWLIHEDLVKGFGLRLEVIQPSHRGSLSTTTDYEVPHPLAGIGAGGRYLVAPGGNGG